MPQVSHPFGLLQQQAEPYPAFTPDQAPFPHTWEDKLNTNQKKYIPNKAKGKTNANSKGNKDAEDVISTPKLPKSPEVMVIGDSMTKFLDEKSLSKKVNVKSFSYPGANLDDIADHIKPAIRQKPKKIIIHAGTNNVNTENPRATRQKFCKILEEIKTEKPDIDIAVSAVIRRADKPGLNNKINQLNSSMENYCNSHNIDFISNNNITQDDLNRGGLHLSRHGLSKLGNNFSKYIDNY